MKIVFTADLHADLSCGYTRGEIARLHDRIRSQGPDVLIHGRDLAGLEKDAMPATLAMLDDVRCLKLAVPGNHDLWLEDGNSLEYYMNDLPDLYTKNGWQLLDALAGPVVHDGIAFVGNMGWYDYSFMDPNLPPTAHRCYETKDWFAVTSWNDGVYVRLGMTDAQFNGYLLKHLSRQLQAVPETVQTIIAVTHHIAFDEMVVRKLSDPAWNFCNAFLGSVELGETLLSDPRIKYHLCGHTHHRSKVQTGSLISINVGCTYDRKRIEVINI